MIGAMRQLLAACLLALAFLPGPAVADEAGPPEAEENSELSEGLGLMGEGARLLLRGLMAEMEPALSEMGQALAEMQPVLTDLARMIGDIRNYHAPEMLPNGDIIMRRKVPLVPESERGEEGGEIEL